MHSMNKNFKNKIEKIRINQGLSQEELADKVKVHQSTISRIEKGKVDISIKMRKKIAKVLDKEPEQLLPWDAPR